MTAAADPLLVQPRQAVRGRARRVRRKLNSRPRKVGQLIAMRTAYAQMTVLKQEEAIAVSRAVEIDDEVWEELKAHAEPLVDTPNTVLRRVLGLSATEDARTASEAVWPQGARRVDRGDENGRRRPPTRRAPMGSLLPESAYESPILRALAARGGSAPARDVVNAVGEMVADRFTELDREKLANGGQRWQSRVQFTRLRLKERGLIKSGSPRGLWELAEAGEELVKAEGGT